eukprot:6184301-Pleurochrysis_carterae.AAC.4
MDNVLSASQNLASNQRVKGQPHGWNGREGCGVQRCQKWIHFMMSPMSRGETMKKPSCLRTDKQSLVQRP